MTDPIKEALDAKAIEWIEGQIHNANIDINGEIAQKEPLNKQAWADHIILLEHILSTLTNASEGGDYALIVRLCEKHGFGRVMQIAQTEWQSRDPIGCLTIGPCPGQTQGGDEIRFMPLDPLTHEQKAALFNEDNSGRAYMTVRQEKTRTPPEDVAITFGMMADGAAVLEKYAPRLEGTHTIAHEMFKAMLAAKKGKGEE